MNTELRELRDDDGGLVALAELRDAEGVIRLELTEDGYDLPELADTMEEADARAAASTYLFALRGVKRQVDANYAEFTVLQDFNKERHVARQSGLIRRMEYLSVTIKALFGFMRPAGKKKSLNLIGGVVGMRAQTEELVIEDDQAVIAWAQEQQVAGIVKVTLSLDRKELRSHMEHARQERRVLGSVADPDRIPPPGVTLGARPDMFYATPAKD